MKWYQVMMVVLGFLFVAACANPVMPRYPEDETNKKDDETPDTSFVVDVSGTRLV